MENLLIIAVVLAVLYIVKTKIESKTGKETNKKQYSYSHKDYLMTRAENEFFKKLELAVENRYYIFPQVHLNSIVNHAVKGQSWKGALSHIQRKSVDFVLCDKEYFKPLLAIELDDSTHNREDRKERDIEVERILQQAQLPLLRFENGSESIETIKEKLNFVFC